jgi:hypothetical protein
MENNRNLLNFGVILGLALIISAAIGSYTFYNIRSTDYITTTGSAKKAVTSDKVKWISTISRKTTLPTVKEGYAKMEADLKEVKAFLVANGVPETEITIMPIFMNEIYDNNYQPEKNYNLTQNIEVNSTEVNKINELSKNTTSLITSKGVLFSTQQVQYYYSGLPEARIELLESAVGDAKARAEKLARAGGKRIGALKSATSGVVQVLSPNSIDVSDYGMYDTSTIEKEIMITVKASFQIK